MFEEKKTELMIVADKKHMQYANYLMALLGQNDDKEDMIIGIKDGTVKAAVYSPEKYRDTIPKITSQTHILFIGSFKEAKQEGENVNFCFEKYGMRYGKLGKRSVMYVEKRMLTKKEFTEFLHYSNSFKKTLAGTTVAMMGKYPKSIEWLRALLPIDINNNVISRFFAKKKTRDQQYRCLAMAVYLEELKKFMED